MISSRLLNLTAMALTLAPKLESFDGYVQDTGGVRWTVNAAVAEAMPATVLSAVLYARFRSRQEYRFADHAEGLRRPPRAEEELNRDVRQPGSCV